MKRIQGIVCFSLTVLIAAIAAQAAFAGDAEVKTFVGTVNQDARFETPDGKEYLIVGDKVEDVIIKQGEKLKLTGELRTEGEGKAIAVTDFKVLDDYEFEKEMEKTKTGSDDRK